MSKIDDCHLKYISNQIQMVSFEIDDIHDKYFSQATNGEYPDVIVMHVPVPHCATIDHKSARVREIVGLSYLFPQYIPLHEASLRYHCWEWLHIKLTQEYHCLENLWMKTDYYFSFNIV